MIQKALLKLLAETPLSFDDAYAALKEIMEGTATPAQIGGFITALRIRGASPDIIAGAAQCMREHAVPIRCADPQAVDIVGTGGDGAHTFNISTAAALVVAGAGVTVAKHGSWGVSSKCGSANVLSELGVNLQYTPQQMEECLEKNGIAFLFAPALHPAMKNAAGPRKELGFWSLFNILGPLCNPAGVHNGVLGVFNEALIPVVADACARLGSHYLFVVHGNDGLDEFTTVSTTRVTEIRRGKLESYEVQPAGLGLTPARPEDLAGGGPSENAEILRRLLRGELHGPKRDIVLLNAAFAIMAGGKAANPPEGLALAAASIDSGRALQKLAALVECSNR